MTKFLLKLFALASTLLFFVSANAQAPEASSETETPTQNQNSDHSWAFDWVRETLHEPMQNGAASVATVSVVIDGKIVIAEGLGSNGGPDGPTVAPQEDLFTIASLTKTFTALAIAQLIDTGVIESIDDPANKYLKRVQLRSFGNVDVTIRQLLTHTAGYEERGFGYVKHGATTTPASPDYARAAIPAIVREPGVRSVYANIDPPILGMIVEDQTGLTMQAYLEENVFNPLGMEHSILNYEPHGDERSVHPWRYNSSGEHEIIQHNANAPFFAPTGSVESTAFDMALYAQALMSDGPITPAIRENLFDPKFRNHPALAANAMAWTVHNWAGHEVVQHAGAFGAYASWIVLLPAQKTAMFVAWAGPPVKENAPSFSFSGVRDSFLVASLGPQTAPNLLAPQPDYQQFEGRYWDERRPQKFPSKLRTLSGPQNLTAKDTGLFLGDRGPYRAIAEDVFVYGDGGNSDYQVIAFRGDHIVRTSGAWEKVSGLSDPTLIQNFAYAAILVAFSGIFAIGWRQGPEKWAAFLLPIAVGGLLWALLGSAPGRGDYLYDLFHGETYRFDVMLGAALGFAVTAIAMSASATMRIFNNEGVSVFLGGIGALHRTLVLIAAIFLTWFASYAHLFQLWRLS